MTDVELLETLGDIVSSECDGDCKYCVLSFANTKCKEDLCRIDNFKGNAEEVIEICEKWRKDHPLKTYADVFFEMFPKVDTTIYHGAKIPAIAFKHLYGGSYIDMDTDMKLWLQPYPEGKNKE